MSLACLTFQIRIALFGALGVFFQPQLLESENCENLGFHLEVYLWPCIAREVGKYHSNVLRRADNWRKNKITFPKKICTNFLLPPFFSLLFFVFREEGNRKYISPSESLSPLLFLAQISQGSRWRSRVQNSDSIPGHQNPWPGPNPCRDLTLTISTIFPPHSCPFQEQLECWGCFLEQPSRYQGHAWSVSGWHKALSPLSPAPFPAPPGNSSRQ